MAVEKGVDPVGNALEVSGQVVRQGIGRLGPMDAFPQPDSLERHFAVLAVAKHGRGVRNDVDAQRRLDQATS